jgi:hypothetical protein
MTTFIWTVFAVIAMIAIFAVCTLIVTVGIRWIDNVLARRRGVPSGPQ